MAKMEVLNLHIRRGRSGPALTVEDILEIARRVLGQNGYAEVCDPAAEHDFVMFLFPLGMPAGWRGWLELQSPSRGWRDLIGPIADGAERELGAEAVLTELYGDKVIDVAPYHYGKPGDRNLGLPQMPTPETAMEMLGLGILTELEDDLSNRQAVLRFRSPVVQPQPQTMTMAQAGELAIPRLLCGEYSDVKTKWKRIMRNVARDGSWSEVIRSLDFVDVRTSPGQFIMADNGWQPTGEHVWCCLVVPQDFGEVCVAAAGSQELDEKRAIEILQEGSQWFWLCLGLLGATRAYWLRKQAMNGLDGRVLCRAILLKLLRWWDTYCRLRSRFEEIPGPGWFTWGVLPAHYCTFAGLATEDEVQDLRNLSPEAAGETMRHWLDREEASRP
jgi:hypothetical protein